MGGSTGSGTKAAAARTLFAGRPNAGTNIAFNPSFTRIVTCRSMLGVDYPSIDEMMAGGERYELVPLPNKMMDTTVWVGSLDEFVTDDDLSNLFSEVSALSSLPACVARNPNASSRMYGFVTFPSVEEKENAIVRMHGRKLNDKRIRVEPISDKPGQNRVRVPGKIVAYVLGYVPKEGGPVSQIKSTHKSGAIDKLHPTTNRQSSNLIHHHRNRDLKSTKSKRKSRGSGGRANGTQMERLHESDQRAFERASRQGFVTLEGTGYRRGRKGSALANLHREWCDAHSKPQIILCKASGGRPLDNVIVDLSPLRLGALSPDADVVGDALSKWRRQILAAAEECGMTLRSDYIEDNSEKILVEIDETDGTTEVLIGIPTIDSSAWAKKPISYLPAVSVGVFEGERVSAKAMVKALSTLWQVSRVDDDDDEYGVGFHDIDVIVDISSRRSSSSSSVGNSPRRGNKDYINGGKRRRTKMKSKMKGLRHHRRNKKGRRNEKELFCW